MCQKILAFKALRLAAAVFMYFFNLAAAERPQHCALVMLKIKILAIFNCFRLYVFMVF